MTRVLFLTRYPIEGASSRYRVFQYLPHLKNLGVDTSVQSFMDTSMYRTSLQTGRTISKIWDVLHATTRRLWTLRRWRDYDIIYMQRELFPFGGLVIERWLKRRGAILFFDFDDALFIKKASRYNRIATFFRSSKKIIDLFRIVDCVVAGNEWLAIEAKDAGALRTTCLEVAEDTGRIPMHTPHTNSSPVTIGWLGSPSTVKYLRLIEPVLQDIASNHPELRWELMGGNDFKMDGVDWKLQDWSLDGELEALARFDIGLMPLPDEDWAKGKSGGKARTYMAAGIVPVVAAIGYNTQLIRNNETGYLCSTPEHWQSNISKLISDPELRQKIANTAREEVNTRFAPTKMAKNMVDLFEQVLTDVRG